MRSLTTLGGVVLVLVAATVGLATTSSPAKPKVAGITWGGTHFTDPATFTAWLRSRGIAYGDWAYQHPLGAYLLTHPAQQLYPAPPSPEPATPVPAPARHRSSALTATLIVLAALLLLFGVVGGLLRRLVPVRFGTADISGARVGAAVGGATLLAVALLAHLL